MRQNSKCRGSDRSTPHIGRTKSHVPGDDAGTRADVNENQLYWNSFVEGWQNGYCTGLENRRPKGLGGSNPSPSVSKSNGIASAGMVRISTVSLGRTCRTRHERPSGE